MKTCLICKKIFNNTHHLQKCCPGECLKLFKKQYMQKYMAPYMKKYQYTNVYKTYRNNYKKSEKFKLEEKERQLKYSKSPERIKYIKEWRKTPIAIISKQISKARRREMKNNCIHIFTKDEWKLKCDKCLGLCPQCNNIFDDVLHKCTLDHILALYWANEYFKQTGIKMVYNIDDIQPLCKSCNSKKGDKIIL